MQNTRHEIVGLLIFAIFVYATGYLYQKSQNPPVVLETSSSEIADIQQGQVPMKIRLVPDAIEKLQEGMEVYLIIEPLEGQEFGATLEYIAPM